VRIVCTCPNETLVLTVIDEQGQTVTQEEIGLIDPDCPEHGIDAFPF
jgi:hypothetical protein